MIWKEISKFPKYFISNTGEVMSKMNCYQYKCSKYILKQRTDKKGYKFVNLYKEKHMYSVKVHRLVAEAFIPNPDNLPQINHKDEDKANNNVENLEWCTAKYNLNYNDLQKRNHIKQKRKIAALSIDNNIVKEFDSASDAANYIYNIGASVNTRSAVCNIVAAANTLQSKLRYGYIWRWQEKSKRKS